MNTPDNNMAIYQAENGAIQLRNDIQGETIWATQKQLAKVFDINVRTINEHIKNIFSDEELAESDAVIRKFRITASDGKNYNTNHYNLDMIISVGYRVNSKVATKFRCWATQTLKQHITQGYTINQQILDEKKGLYLEMISDIKKIASQGNVVSTGAILDIIQSFSQTWFSLQSYDEGTIPNSGFTDNGLTINAQSLYADIAIFKKQLLEKGEATELFAQEKIPRALEGILGNVMQTAFGNDVYKTLEEKAVHLFYFIIKNHPFNDGNKRTGAFTFIWFLEKTKIDFKNHITPEALTALTLLVAQSDPQDKERIIGLMLLMFKK